jgi:hypothetical protein
LKDLKFQHEEFDDKLELNEFFCKVCNKESNTAFARLQNLVTKLVLTV